MSKGWLQVAIVTQLIGLDQRCEPAIFNSSLFLNYTLGFWDKLLLSEAHSSPPSPPEQIQFQGVLFTDSSCLCHA